MVPELPLMVKPPAVVVSRVSFVLAYPPEVLKTGSVPSPKLKLNASGSIPNETLTTSLLLNACVPDSRIGSLIGIWKLAVPT